MTKPHPSYNEIRSCGNCKFVFIKSDYDEERTYFCTKNAPTRPPCMSMAMGENPLYPTQEVVDGEELMKHYAIWEQWGDPRQVELNGKCKHYKDSR